MDLFEPKTMTIDDVLFTNLAEDTTTEWNDSTDYVIPTSGTAVTEVKLSYEEDLSTPRIPHLYRLRSDSAAGHYPPKYPGEWQDRGPTNRYLMFDDDLTRQAAADNTEATDQGKMVFKIKTGKMDRIRLDAVSATSAKFELYDGDDGLVETVEYSLIDSSGVVSWSTFFYDDRTWINGLVHKFTLYHVSAMRITLEDTRAGYYPKLGMCLPSRKRPIGFTKFGIETTVMDMGDGTFKKILQTDAWVDPVNMPYVQRLFANLYGKAVVLEANNPGIDFDNFLVVGKYESFSLAYRQEGNVVLDIRMVGLEENKE